MRCFRVGEDMDKGLELMQQYKQVLAEREEQRTHLSDAQQLFGLKAQSFEKLNAVRKEMEVLDVIYSVYEEQKHARDEWAQALWSDLHMEVLEQGIDAFATRVRRMPDNVKEHPLWQVLSKRIKEFKDTLPLLTDLKSEALRDRHWKQLMNRSGSPLSRLSVTSICQSAGSLSFGTETV